MAEAGRPLIFESAEELQELIDAYFELCDNATIKDDDGKTLRFKPYTMSGLALAIGCDRKTLLNYSHREAFFPTLKKAKERVQNYAEESLYSNPRTAGVIFSLKNNHDWRDKQEIEQTVHNDLIKVTLVDDGNTDTD